MPMTSMHASRADHEACRELLRQGSRSFHAASKLLPARVFEPIGALYAFCRLADDEIDNEVDGRAAEPTSPEAALSRLHVRLDAAYLGRPRNHPVDRALADMLATSGMPRALPEALLEGFAWDAQHRHYDTLSDVLAYAARVAGAVGAMMTLLMHRTAPVTVARACDLGVAMQLSNIARDVGEDARAGRLYLPRDWMRQAGIDPDEWLADPQFTPALAAVVARLLDVAQELYRRADSGIVALPITCRPAIGAARLIYAEIGQEVARAGYDSISRRAVVSDRRKLALLARSVARSVVPRPRCNFVPLAETRFLVEAVQHMARPVATADSLVGRVITIFARLEQRDALSNAGVLNS